MNDLSDNPAAYLQDRPVLNRRQARLLAVIAPICLATIGVLLGETSIVAQLENASLDWRFRLRGPRAPREDIVIVEIDEASRRELREGWQRFELRRHLPAAIENLIDAGALVVGLDFWLADLTDPEVDARLADTLAQTDTVLSFTHTDGLTKRSAPLFLETEPFEGCINVEPDADGELRRLPPYLYIETFDEDVTQREQIPHFPLMLALYALWETDPEMQIEFVDREARLGTRTVAAGELIDFAAPRGAGWRKVSFADAAFGRFDADLVNRAVVLIGETRSIADTFAMPLAARPDPGVYYHANVVAQILDGRRFDETFARGPYHACAVGFLGLAAGLFACNQRPWWRHQRSTLLLAAYLTGGLFVFLGGWAALAVMTFGRNLELPMAGPIVAMAVALGIGFAGQWLIVSANTSRLMQRTRKIEALFGQSVSASVLDALRSDPRQITETQTREVTVLFCDIRNFTALTAGVDPAAVAGALNEYFNEVTAAVFAENGFLDKFVGDEIMAVFSVPLPQPDHAGRAVRTAIAIKRRVAALNGRRAERGDPAFECGIGIHTGIAAAGHIGSQERSNFTVIGETVNLAARIESFTQGGEILISTATRDRLDDQTPVAPWQEVEIRGLEGKHALHIVRPEAIT